MIDVKVASKKNDGACVAAFLWGKLSAKTMFCDTKNYFACQGVGIVVDDVVNERKVVEKYVLL